MKKIITLFLLLGSTYVFGQITQLYSGTDVTLNNLSVINNDIIISGATNNFLVQSFNECNQLNTLSSPAPYNYFNRFQRISTDTMFMLSFVNGALLYRSTDGGNTWDKRMDTTIFAPNSFGFFNAQEGITDKGLFSTLLRTLDGGASWTATVSPLYAIDLLRIYDDSTIIVGGIAVPGAFGEFYLSWNRGNTWPSSGGCPGEPTDFYFLNHDTILGICSPNQFGLGASFIKTINKGQSWQNSPIPLRNPYGINFKNAYEGYVIGSDVNNQGVILKTMDFGQNWQTFNTGISTTLINLAFLNDSIALLTGTNGVLLRWNYKQSVFTGVNENEIDHLSINIFPNPLTHDKLTINTNNINSFSASIFNICGQQQSFTENLTSPAELDFNSLPKGIYFIEVCSNNWCKVVKVIK